MLSGPRFSAHRFEIIRQNHCFSVYRNFTARELLVIACASSDLRVIISEVNRHDHQAFQPVIDSSVIGRMKPTLPGARVIQLLLQRERVKRKPEDVNPFTCVLRRAVSDLSERQAAQLHLDGNRHIVDVSTDIRPDRAQVSFHLTLRDSRVADQALIDGNLAAAMLFGFSDPVFASDGRLVSEMRSPDASLSQRDQTRATMTHEGSVIPACFPGRQLLTVRLPCCGEHVNYYLKTYEAAKKSNA